jgi:hypothetical protein
MKTTVTMTYVIGGIPPAHDYDLIRAIKAQLDEPGVRQQMLDEFIIEIKRDRRVSA